ncbi:potassium channel family protein [Alteromonas confluentis]|uniref:Potassium transporter TrkA n=1 Tax=Alteromonas confluentis TaxID=1656094 RepID=A0A1E7ZEX2_9ALTE|nr:TrkA family potassium uptake protein [Alteromonas confluentis]OFC72030.1 potassium transporter TrkA [Alteromonas confluentis]
MAHFTVIGLGRFGITTSLELIHLGHTVTGIDIDEKLAEQYASDLTQTLICDATDERAMAELSLHDSEAVIVAIGEDMQASLLCVLNLKHENVSNIWVKANSQAHHTILSKLDVARIIHPEEEMGVRVAQALNYPMVNDYLSLGHGHYIVEVVIPQKRTPFTLNDLINGYKNDIHCLMIKRRQSIHCSPDSTFGFETDDQVILSGPREILAKIAPRLSR